MMTKPSTATWTRQAEDTGRLIGISGAVVIGAFPVWRFGPEQASDPRNIGGAVAITIESVVTDAALAPWQHMEQEPADEPVLS